MAIVAKYTGDGSAFYNGIPARDLDEADFAGLTDEQKATLAASPLYDLRREAPKEAAAAERRVERAAVAEATPAEGKKS